MCVYESMKWKNSKLRFAHFRISLLPGRTTTDSHNFTLEQITTGLERQKDWVKRIALATVLERKFAEKPKGGALVLLLVMQLGLERQKDWGKG